MKDLGEVDVILGINIIRTPKFYKVFTLTLYKYSFENFGYSNYVLF
jgi:hypothetical protein